MRAFRKNDGALWEFPIFYPGGVFLVPIHFLIIWGFLFSNYLGIYFVFSWLNGALFIFPFSFRAHMPWGRGSDYEWLWERFKNIIMII